MPCLIFMWSMGRSLRGCMQKWALEQEPAKRRVRMALALEKAGQSRYTHALLQHGRMSAGYDGTGLRYLEDLEHKRLDMVWYYIHQRLLGNKHVRT